MFKDSICLRIACIYGLYLFEDCMCLRIVFV